MPIFHARIPNFLFALFLRTMPQLRNDPVALIGPDERVWSASPAAKDDGVELGLTAHQARMRCADCRVHELNLAHIEDADAAFVGVLTQTGLPAEGQRFGAAYLDLTPVAHSPEDALEVCAQLGRDIRHELGEAPALGCNCGKFTARAAACIVPAGRLRLVNATDEISFLTPLPITLLPLPLSALQQLQWLGITTLGEFIRLPLSGLVQRFGVAGKLAHQLARGRDDRPVLPQANDAPQRISVEIDAPLASSHQASSLVRYAIQPALNDLRDRCVGARRVLVQMRFLNGAVLDEVYTLPAPTHDLETLCAGVGRLLTRLAWPAELVALEIDLLDIAELVSEQLTLFALDVPPVGEALRELAQTLLPRHGPVFFNARVSEATHPIAERRTTWAALGMAA